MIYQIECKTEKASFSLTDNYGRTLVFPSYKSAYTFIREKGDMITYDLGNIELTAYAVSSKDMTEEEIERMFEFLIEIKGW